MSNSMPFTLLVHNLSPHLERRPGVWKFGPPIRVEVKDDLYEVESFSYDSRGVVLTLGERIGYKPDEGCPHCTLHVDECACRDDPADTPHDHAGYAENE